MSAMVTLDLINQFVQVFYQKLDNKESRDTLGDLYMESASLVWNGECIKSKSEIVKHYKNLPPTSVILQSVDTQNMPMMGDLGDLLTVVVGGKITYSSSEATFGQTFIVAAHNGLLRIVSDNIRIQN